MEQLERLKTRYKAFKLWQQQPHQVKPMTDEEHDCATCHTHFRGNYCPRCGQSATVGRYSLKKALLLFLDVWGLGNRGMFRTIRDLLLRPGYMIRDYLQGMQMAYFPPFKMFFLLAALSLFVDTGFNIRGENRVERLMNYSMDTNASVDSMMNVVISIDTARVASAADSAAQRSALPADSAALDTTEAQAGKPTADATAKTTEEKFVQSILRWIFDHQTFFLFVWLLVLSGPLYLFFRRSPAIPDIRYSEFFVAMVYTTNMMSIVSVVGSFLCLNAYGWDGLCALLSIIPLKQLSGYSYRRTLLHIALAFSVLMLAIFLVAFAGAFVAGMFLT